MLYYSGIDWIGSRGGEESTCRTSFIFHSEFNSKRRILRLSRQDLQPSFGWVGARHCNRIPPHASLTRRHIIHRAPICQLSKTARQVKYGCKISWRFDFVNDKYENSVPLLVLRCLSQGMTCSFHYTTIWLNLLLLLDRQLVMSVIVTKSRMTRRASICLHNSWVIIMWLIAQLKWFAHFVFVNRPAIYLHNG